jgi:hypothetical protein
MAAMTAERNDQQERAPRAIDHVRLAQNIQRTLNRVGFVDTNQDSSLAIDLSLIALECISMTEAIETLGERRVSRKRLLDSLTELEVGLPHIHEHSTSSIDKIRRMLKELSAESS